MRPQSRSSVATAFGWVLRERSAKAWGARPGASGVHEAGGQFKSAGLEIAQDGTPGALALALARFAGEQHFIAVTQGAHDDEQCLGAIIKTALDVQPIGPGVDELECREVGFP